MDHPLSPLPQVTEPQNIGIETDITSDNVKSAENWGQSTQNQPISSQPSENADVISTHAHINRRYTPHPLALRQRALPILVINTEPVNKLVQSVAKRKLEHINLIQNVDITVSQLLGSLGSTIYKLNSSIKSVAGTMPMSEVELRFMDGVMMDSLDRRVAEELLTQAVYPQPKHDEGNIATHTLHQHITQLANSSSEISKLHDQNGTALAASSDIPWLRRFRLFLDGQTDHVQHDYCGMPVVTLLFATTSSFDTNAANYSNFNDNPDLLDTIDNVVEKPTDYVALFTELLNTHHLPSTFRNGHYDPNGMKRVCVLLHDENSSIKMNEQEARANFARALPGLDLFILRVNSGGNNKVVTDFCGYSEAYSGRGSAPKMNQKEDSNTLIELSAYDAQTFRSFLYEMTKHIVIPEMEKRISTLNVVVSNTKKGVKNALKSLWRKPKENEIAANIENTARYPYHQIESKVRLLADSLFLIRDYDAALGVYRLIKGDFASDKAMVHFGGIHEMIALCLFMIDPHGRNGKDIQSAVENALYAFARGADEERLSNQDQSSSRPMQRTQTALITTRLATRLCLVACASKQFTSSRHLEYAECLAGASVHETPLGAAVLLEQASLQYLRAGMIRKYAFHMLMAAHMYRSSGQESHGMRCFTAAYHIYQKSRWCELYDHLQSALAHQSYILEQPAVALQLYCRLAGSGRVSAKMQERILFNFLDICERYPAGSLTAIDNMKKDLTQNKLISHHKNLPENIHFALEIPCVDLPKVIDRSIFVSDEITIPRNGGLTRWDSAASAGNELEHASQADDPALQPLWDEMNRDISAEFSVSKSENPSAEEFIKKVEEQRLGGALNKNISLGPKRRAREEPFVVSVALTNPLALPVLLTNIQLIACFETEDIVCSNIVPIESLKNDRTWSFRSSNQTFIVPEFIQFSTKTDDHDFNLPSFFVVDKQSVNINAGEVVNMQLSICPLVKGKLEILGFRCRLADKVWISHEFKQANSSGSNRSRKSSKSGDGLLSIIGERMPSLNVVIDSSMSKVLQGEIGEWTIKVENLGSSPAKNVLLKTNFPWLSIQNKFDTMLANSDSIGGSIGVSGTVVAITEGEQCIEANESIELKARVRFDGVGKQQLRLLFRYEHANEISRIRYVRKVFNMTVYPSLSLHTSISPSYRNINEKILSIEFTNNRSGNNSVSNIELSNIAFFSMNYKVTLIPGQMQVSRPEIKHPSSLKRYEQTALHFWLEEVELQSEDSLSIVYPLSENLNTEVDVDFLCLFNAWEQLNQVHQQKEEEKLKRSAGFSGMVQPRSIHQIRRDNRETDVEVNLFPDNESEPSSSPKFVSPTSFDALCNLKFPDGSFPLHIICNWKAGTSNDGIVNGQHYLHNGSVSTEARWPFIITAKYPLKVTHDFTFKLSYSTDLEVTIKNQLSHSTKFAFNIKSITGIHYSGMTEFEHTLDGKDEVVIPLRATVYSPGVYELQNVRLTTLDSIGRIFEFEDISWLLKVN